MQCAWSICECRSAPTDQWNQELLKSFVRKLKAHLGNPHSGLRVWIVFLIERGTPKIISYPVKDKMTETLSQITVTYSESQSRAFTDGWQGYKFWVMLAMDISLSITNTFQQSYKNAVTGGRGGGGGCMGQHTHFITKEGEGNRYDGGQPLGQSHCMHGSRNQELWHQFFN